MMSSFKFSLKKNNREVSIPQTKSSHLINKDQELKRKILPDMMIEHWDKFELEDSVDNTTTIHAYFHKHH